MTAIVPVLLLALGAAPELDDTLPPRGQFEVKHNETLTLRMGAFLSGLVDASTVQPLADGQVRATDARLVLNIDLDDTLDVFVQTEMLLRPPVLDLVWRYRPAKNLWLRVGRMKVPFGGEALVPDGLIDFNAPAQLTDALSLRRSTGLEGGVATPDGGLVLRGGVFGQPRHAWSDEQNLIAALRARLLVPLNDTSFVHVATSGAASLDDGVTLPGVAEPYSGTRVLLSTDLRTQLAALMVSAEATGTVFSALRGEATWAGGHQVTIAYSLLDWLIPLIRWDAFYRQGLPGRHLIIPSLTVAVPQHPEFVFQADVYVPIERPPDSRLLVSITLMR